MNFTFHKDNYNNWYTNKELYRNNKPLNRYCYILKTYLGENGRLNNHYLIGKKLYRKEDNKTWNIESVNVHYYYGGYYYCLLLECNGSHVFINWENINSDYELILNNINMNRSKYELIER